ncbi:unnamed protein product [Absidia cylindrospora]
MRSTTKQMIGNYQLVETIGRGVSGKVKLGIHVHTGEEVAIKIIPRHQMNQSSIVAQAVEQELAILQLLDHPHLVELRHVMQDSVNVYFVMEYMNGGDLYQALTQGRGRLSESQAKSYFTQIVGALAWCHTHHICHRDLKLENILLEKNKNYVKIADFGMSKMQPKETLLRTSCGSPHYASPEIIKGIPYYGPATDVWSCGVILYLLLTGYHPFDDKRTSRLLFKIKNGRYNRRMPGDISSSAKDLIEKMLTVNPTERINIHDVLTHAWMLPPSSQSRFPDPWFEYDHLVQPLVKQSCVMEGWVWETLKVLWRDMGPDRILLALASHGPNVQKLTYRLLNQRNDRLLGKTSTNQHTTEKQPIPIPNTHSDSNAILDSYLSNSTTLYDQSTPISLRSYMTSSIPEKALSPPTFATTNTETSLICQNFSPSYQNENQMNLTSPVTTAFFSQPSISFQRYYRQQLWYPFHFDSISRRLVQQTTKSSSVFPTISFGSHVIPPPSSPVKTEPSFGLPTSISTASVSNETTTSSFSMSSSIASSLATSSMILLGNTVQYCEHLYRQAHSLLHQFIHRPQTTAPTKTFSIGCSAKNAWDAAGKLHQVLEENYSGQLCHRGYSQGQMIWTGFIQLPDEQNKLYFACYIPTVSNTRRVRVNFSLLRGDTTSMSSAMDQLLKTLNDYEREAKMVADSNGWKQQRRMMQSTTNISSAQLVD